MGTGGHCKSHTAISKSRLKFSAPANLLRVAPVAAREVKREFTFNHGAKGRIPFTEPDPDSTRSKGSGDNVWLAPFIRIRPVAAAPAAGGGA